MSIRVLLVDPDNSIVMAFARSLRHWGFDILTASSEHDCLRQLCGSAPDVLVLEPDTGDDWGYRLLTRQHPRKPPDVPTVVVSRWTPDHVNHSSELPIFRWHTKPVRTKDLAATLSRAVQNCSG